MEKKILTLDEACEYLGYNRRYIQNLTQKGIIPHGKPTNGKVFFDREKLESWMLSGGKQKSTAENTTSQTNTTAHA